MCYDGMSECEKGLTMIRSILFAAALSISAAAAPATAQSVEDASAIEGVIMSQVEAMGADNWELAFTFASPTIQGIFRDPYNFSQMVQRGYPMVWKPRQVTAGALTNTPQGLVQTMLFEDQQGRIYIADYQMQMIDGVWRINGVMIRPAEQGNA